MADISVYTRIISEAERGEGVRDAIVDALEAMNTYGGNASTLEGHPASYFATASLFSALIGQVGEVDDVLIAIENGLNALKYNMGEYTLSGEGGTFTVDCTGIKGYDNLDTTKFYFELLGGSGSHPVGSWTPQQSYNGQTGVFTYTWGAMSADIRVKLWVVKPTKTAIGTGVTELYVTANGTFDAGDHAAYNPVIVQVPNTLDTRRLTQDINQNGSYHFTPEPNTAFSDANINVNVPEKKLETKEITENGVYRAIDEEPRVDGFSVISVNVDSKVLIEDKRITENGHYQAIDEGGDGYVDVLVDVDPEAVLGHKVVGQNGDYYAEDDDFDGYSSITVAVPTADLIRKVITTNGTFRASDESPVVDGFYEVKVAVSGGGSYPVNSVNYLIANNRYSYDSFPEVMSMFETSEITDWTNFFRDCTINDGDIDLTGLDVSSATDMNQMFYNIKCDVLTLDEHIFDGPLSSSNPVTGMFENSTIGKIVFGACKFPKNCYRMFAWGPINEIEMNSCDLSDVGNINNADSMSGMFAGVSGDFIDMVDECVGQIFYEIKRALFYRAAFTNLKGSLTGGKTFGKVKDASYMFQDYRGNIDNLDPSIFDYSECTTIYCIFDNISNASVSGTELKLSFKNASIPLCTDARNVVNGSTRIRKLEFDGLSLAIATDVRSLLRASYARIITATGMNLPRATCFDSFFGDVHRARFIDLNGITVGSGVITDCENFIRDSSFNENSSFTKVFTAEVGTNTVVLSVSDDEKNWLWYEGRDDGYNYVTYFAIHPDVTIDSVVFDYTAKTLTVEYTNSGESDISTRLVVSPNQHMFLPKTFDCTGITNANYRPFYNELGYALMDLYTDGTKQEIAALNWFNPASSGGYGDGAVIGEIHYETTHAAFLALPEVVYNRYLRRYGYFTIINEFTKDDVNEIRYTLSQDGLTLTVEIESTGSGNSNDNGITFYVGYAANSKVRFQSSSAPYVQCGICKAFSNMPRLQRNGWNRGSFGYKNRNAAAMDYTVTASDNTPKFFFGCSLEGAETSTITITILTS